MIELNSKNNVLMECEYKYSLQDRQTGNLYRDMFPYEEIPKCTFNFRLTPANPPEQIWITDTTFRDGQQSRAPYEPEQIVELFKLLHRLGGPKGIIRQSEFFVYSERDRKALRMCQELGYEFPEITGWIRASREDFKLARDLGLRECGILVSCSDYHIYKKLKKTRRQAVDGYLAVIKDALDAGIYPRCHFEDITRADFYGFVVPFAHEIKAVVNSATAWLYGAASVNCSLLGIGERTGNTPLEAMVIEYAQLRGTLDGMDTTVIRDIADYYEKELGYRIPANTPFVGESFNTTQAGIHADGLLKDEEIYSIFDTRNILKSPPRVGISRNSGAAGIAVWLTQKLGRPVAKTEEIVRILKNWVDDQYEAGRVTNIGDSELWNVYKQMEADEA